MMPGVRILSIFSLSPKRDQQVLRTTYIHSATILFIIGCSACAILVYRILEPFLQSILWSILAGAFLFPFKKQLTSIARCHLRELDNDSHLLFYGVVIILPIRVFDNAIESLGALCIRKWKQLLLIILVLPSIECLQSGALYNYVKKIGYDCYILFGSHIHLFDSQRIMWLILVYIFAILTLYNSSWIINSILNKCSILIWFILFIRLSQLVPSNYRLIVVILTVILMIVGFVVEQCHAESQTTTVSQYQTSTSTSLLNIFESIQISCRKKSSSKVNSFLSSSSSTSYFIYVLWSFIAIKVYHFYQYLIPISMFIIIYKIIKFILIYTYKALSRQPRIQSIIQNLKQYLLVRRDVLTPPLLRNLVWFLFKGDKKLNHGLQGSIDSLVSAFMIVTLFIVILFGSILLVVQIHDESIHMIKLTSNIVNETLVLRHFLPDKQHMTDFIETTLTNVHTAGRNWIISQVAKVQPARVEAKCCLPLSINSGEDTYMHSTTHGHVSLSNKNLEEQLLDLWDRLYSYVTNTSTLFATNMSHDREIYSSPNQNLFNYMQTNFGLQMNDFYSIISDNIDVLRTILDSIWSNAALISTIVSTLISLLFTGGFVLFNFFVALFVFVTSLFYLLSHSDQTTYRPTIWLNNALAIGGPGLGKAVNDVVTSVFIASIKIAAFYGLYTYVLHILLRSNFVFLPVVIASICAIALQSYWAALPGCLDLWLVQHRPFSALILLLSHIVPAYFVDTAIYSEVKGGGHQYLTVLAIAGGVYYQGIQGALSGPIILCCLLVSFRMYNETIARSLSLNSNQMTISSTVMKPYRNRSHSLQPLLTKSDYL